jgi:hypothetical protein
MNALDNVFLFFKPAPHSGFIWATLTSIEQVPPVPPMLPGAIAAASGVSLLSYTGGSTPMISFNVTFKYKILGGSLPIVPVTLTQHNPGLPSVFYSLDIPAIPFSCPHVTVDAMSDVTYGSQGAHFVTLALKHGPQGQG